MIQKFDGLTIRYARLKPSLQRMPSYSLPASSIGCNLSQFVDQLRLCGRLLEHLEDENHIGLCGVISFGVLQSRQVLILKFFLE